MLGSRLSYANILLFVQDLSVCVKRALGANGILYDICMIVVYCCSASANAAAFAFVFLWCSVAAIGASVAALCCWWQYLAQAIGFFGTAFSGVDRQFAIKWIHVDVVFFGDVR